MAKIVFSYSHVDEALRNELEKNLAPLKRAGLISTWHDRRIIAGQEFEEEIDRNFAEAELILLLVSPDFINSDYCYKVEMEHALQRHKAKTAVVLPVILRPCHWHDLPFGKLLAATPDGKPVTRYPSLDDGFFDVVTSVKSALKLLNSMVPPATTQLPSTPVISARTMNIQVEALAVSARSSNLRIKKEFTDRDRDSARTAYFEYVAKYFDNSLSEIASRNTEVEASYRRIDANSFEATIYITGKKRCFCGISLGNSHMGRGIQFSFDGVKANSYNEYMSLEDDGFILGFKPLGMGFQSKHARGLLNEEGVAEYLWDMFIKPLQQ